MSLFAGIYAINHRKSIEQTTRERMAKALSSSGDNLQILSTPYFFLAKFDFGAFGESGYAEDKKYGVTAIAGEPILTCSHQEQFSRLNDLKIISEKFSQGNIEILASCNGTFSVCSYTPTNHAFILATDKLGSRPVYYYVNEDFVYFSSCLKALEPIEDIPKRADINAFVEQTIFGVPLGKKTMYLDIKVLRDGEYFIADEHDEPKLSFYFRWDHISPVQKSQEVLLDECYTVFASAIKSRSNKSQQVFSFLSGGLDSRCVVAMLHRLGKQVIAFNSSRSGEQDQIFAEQYARRLNIQYIAAQRPNYVASTAKLFEEAIKTTSRELKSLTYPQLVFSGDGGSVGLGFVYMDETLFDLLKEGNQDQAIHYFLKDWGRLPQKIISPKMWQHIREIPFQGMKAEIDDLRLDDPERTIYLFLLRNDQRRHLHGYYEQIDQHRVELLLPFYDSRLLELIVSAPTLRPFLYHDFYHKWLQRFPEQTTSVPWQTYPGHRPCPIAPQNEILTQWQKFKNDEFAISKPWVKKCMHILRKRNFPGMFMRRTKVLFALLLHCLRIRNYMYAFKFCVNFYELHTKAPFSSFEKGLDTIPNNQQSFQ